MRSFNSNKHCSARGGYTLFEMLMVQALLVAMVAISWPALRSPLGKNQLLDAARQIRTEFSKARHEAIETGVAQQFRYQPGGSEFEVVSADAARTRNNRGMTDIRDQRHSEVDGDREGEDGPQIVTCRKLPEEIIFIDTDLEESSDSSSQSSTEKIANDLEQGLSESQKWSTPIMFYPNGRTSNATLRLRGDRNFEVNVALRGLTGIPTVGEVHKPAKDQK